MRLLRCAVLFVTVSSNNSYNNNRRYSTATTQQPEQCLKCRYTGVYEAMNDKNPPTVEQLALVNSKRYSDLPKGNNNNNNNNNNNHSENITKRQREILPHSTNYDANHIRKFGFENGFCITTCCAAAGSGKTTTAKSLSLSYNIQREQIPSYFPFNKAPVTELNAWQRDLGICSMRASTIDSLCWNGANSQCRVFYEPPRNNNNNNDQRRGDGDEQDEEKLPPITNNNFAERFLPPETHILNRALSDETHEGIDKEQLIAARQTLADYLAHHRNLVQDEAFLTPKQKLAREKKKNKKNKNNKKNIHRQRPADVAPYHSDDPLFLSSFFTSKICSARVCIEKIISNFTNSDMNPEEMDFRLLKCSRQGNTSCDLSDEDVVIVHREKVPVWASAATNIHEEEEEHEDDAHKRANFATGCSLCIQFHDELVLCARAYFSFLTRRQDRPTLPRDSLLLDGSSMKFALAQKWCQLSLSAYKKSQCEKKTCQPMGVRRGRVITDDDENNDNSTQQHHHTPNHNISFTATSLSQNSSQGSYDSCQSSQNRSLDGEKVFCVLRGIGLSRKKFIEPGCPLIIDEAQDLNPCNVALMIDLAILNNSQLYLIGDACQSIYGFRGARPKFFVHPDLSSALSNKADGDNSFEALMLRSSAESFMYNDDNTFNKQNAVNFMIEKTTLSISFRFGAPVAHLGNFVLFSMKIAKTASSRPIEPDADSFINKVYALEQKQSHVLPYSQHLYYGDVYGLVSRVSQYTDDHTTGTRYFSNNNKISNNYDYTKCDFISQLNVDIIQLERDNMSVIRGAIKLAMHQLDEDDVIGATADHYLFEIFVTQSGAGGGGKSLQSATAKLKVLLLVALENFDFGCEMSENGDVLLDENNNVVVESLVNFEFDKKYQKDILALRESQLYKKLANTYEAPFQYSQLLRDLKIAREIKEKKQQKKWNKGKEQHQQNNDDADENFVKNDFEFDEETEALLNDVARSVLCIEELARDYAQIAFSEYNCFEPEEVSHFDSGLINKKRKFYRKCFKAIISEVHESSLLQGEENIRKGSTKTDQQKRKIDIRRRVDVQRRKIMLYSTCHQAKGQEYDTVIVGQSLLRLGPTFDQTEDQYTLLVKGRSASVDEFNILYVALTRAKKFLWIPESLWFWSCLVPLRRPLEELLVSKEEYERSRSLFGSCKKRMNPQQQQQQQQQPLNNNNQNHNGGIIPQPREEVVQEDSGLLFMEAGLNLLENKDELSGLIAPAPVLVPTTIKMEQEEQFNSGVKIEQQVEEDDSIFMIPHSHKDRVCRGEMNQREYHDEEVCAAVEGLIDLQPSSPWQLQQLAESLVSFRRDVLKVDIEETIRNCGRNTGNTNNNEAERQRHFSRTLKFLMNKNNDSSPADVIACGWCICGISCKRYRAEIDHVERNFPIDEDSSFFAGESNYYNKKKEEENAIPVPLHLDAQSLRLVLCVLKRARRLAEMRFEAETHLKELLVMRSTSDQLLHDDDGVNDDPRMRLARKNLQLATMWNNCLHQVFANEQCDARIAQKLFHEEKRFYAHQASGI